MRNQMLYIDGRWQDTAEHRTLADRWTGGLLGTVAVGSADNAVAAVDAAAQAMASRFAAPDRSRILSNVGRLVTGRSEEFAQLITAELGKPITASRSEVGRAVETLQLSAEEAKRLPGETVPLDATANGADTLAFTIPTPRGVVAAVTPFNFPLNLLVHKVGPALAAGCAVVVKPSSHAPLTAGLLVELFEEAGLPAGWLNLVTGPPEKIVGAWQSDPRVAVITFTGSSAVGWQLKTQSPRKRHILELGSNTAMFVAADADLTRAARSAVGAAFGNSGQSCVSLQRIYVARPVAEAFVASLVENVEECAFGDPRDEATVVGPLVSTEETTRIVDWIEGAKQGGARVAVGGTQVDGILAPTVLVDVPKDSPLLCQEVFGPVVSVVLVDDLRQALAEVNASDYGLNTAIYTADIATAMEYARKAEAGSVLVNMPSSFRTDAMPYGGVKGSGQGREGVKYAVAELLQEKLVVLHQ